MFYLISETVVVGQGYFFSQQTENHIIAHNYIQIKLFCVNSYFLWNFLLLIRKCNRMVLLRSWCMQQGYFNNRWLWCSSLCFIYREKVLTDLSSKGNWKITMIKLIWTEMKLRHKDLWACSIKKLFSIVSFKAY